MASNDETWDASGIDPRLIPGIIVLVLLVVVLSGVTLYVYRKCPCQGGEEEVEEIALEERAQAGR
jgi:hypothetical protein